MVYSWITRCLIDNGTALIPGTQLTFTAQIRTSSALDDQSTVLAVCVRLRCLKLLSTPVVFSENQPG